MVEIRSLGSKQVEQGVTSPLEDLFFKASGVLLIFPESSRAEPSSNGQGFCQARVPAVSKSEADLFWKLFQTPTANSDQLAQRSSLISEIILADSFDELSLRGTAGSCGFWLERMLCPSTREELRSEREGDTARPQLSEVLSRVKNIKELERALTAGNEATIDFFKSIESYDTEVGSAFENLSKGKKLLRVFCEALSSINNNLLKSEVLAIQDLVEKLPSFDSARVIHEWQRDGRSDHLDELKKHYATLTDKLLKVGAVIALARFVSDNQLVLGTTNPDTPQGYVQGWNGFREKSSQSGKTQVANDSTDQARMTVLRSSNMSGKSFFLESKYWMHLIYQTTGYAPALNANLKLYDGLFHLDRPVTHSGTGNSAFGQEVAQQERALTLSENLKQVLYIMDEPGSSTDHRDQKRLIAGLVDYITNELGADVLIATHNQSLEAVLEKRGARVYHFEILEQSDGQLVYTHKLCPGAFPSSGLKVAAREGLPAVYIERAKKFNDPQTDTTLLLPKVAFESIQPYSEREREELKKQAGSFRILVPEANELVTADRALYWGYSRTWRVTTAFGTVATLPRDILNHHGVEFCTAQVNIKSCFKEIAANASYSFSEGIWQLVNSIGSLAKKKGLDTQQEKSLLLFGQAANPAELLERQNLYQKLIDENLFEKLIIQVGRAQQLFEAIRNLAVPEWQSFQSMWNCIEETSRSFPDASSTKNLFEHLALSVKLDLIFIDFLAGLSGIEVDPHERKRAWNCIAQLDSCVREYQEQIEKLKLEQRVLSGEQADLRKKYEDVFLAIRSKLKDYLPDLDPEKHYDFSYYQKAYERVHTSFPKTKQAISSVKFCWQQVPSERVKQEIEKFKSQLEKLPKSYLSVASRTDSFMMFKTCEQVFSKETPLEDLVCTLEQIDSVHLRQFALYMRKVWEPLFGGINKPIEWLWGKMFEQRDTSLPDCPFFSPEVGQGLVDDLESFSAVLRVAGIIKQHRFCKGKLSKDGRFFFNNLWLTKNERFEEFKRSIAQTLPTNGLERLVNWAGPNMSGKTFTTEAQIFATLCFLSTGFAPADEFEAPFYAGVVYKGRSSTNVEEFKEVDRLAMLAKGPLAIFLDEAWSSTSPDEEAALLYGTTLPLAEAGHRVSATTHSHDYVDEVGKLSGVSTLHLKTVISESGQVEFTREVLLGSDASHGVAIAKHLGLREQIIKRALDVD